jgi:DNA topoisomerase I
MRVPLRLQTQIQPTHGEPLAVPSCMPTQTPPRSSARSAGLRYVSDTDPGIVRVRVGRGFRYRDARGRRVTNAATLARIRSLVIPPAWERVWICSSPYGHVQATGRDARGRKQYRYHPRWAETRDESKYGRLLAFGRALAGIRRRTARDLGAQPLSRARVLATVVRLLETTSIRVGNEEYARANGSYGLTTMQDRHVTVRGSRIRFRFRAKSGVLQTIDLEDARLAHSVKHCQDLPGQTLFQYVDETGRRASVGSSDVNAYLREITGEDFTAKDFRTWAGTVMAACALRAIAARESADTPTERLRKRHLVEAIDEVASRLGNTRAVSRRCYVHPRVLEAYMQGRTIASATSAAAGAGSRRQRLSADERAVLALLVSPSPRAASGRGVSARRAPAPRRSSATGSPARRASRARRARRRTRAARAARLR